MILSALDLLDFCLADVRGGLGPYVNVLLVTDAHWSQFAVGSTLMVSGLIGVAAHPMVGAFIDRTHRKREAIIFGAFLLAACALALATWPILPVVLAADVIMAVLGGLFAPAIAAITLGLFGHESLAARLGRNAAFDKGGNIFIALVAGVIGFAVSQKAPFFLVPCFAVLTTAAALSIPANAIDHARARGLEPNAKHEEHPANWWALLNDRPLVVFAGSAAIFYFADTPMLPLVAQKLALAHPGLETGLTSLSIILAQLVTILMALLVTRANVLGRRPLLIAAFVALVMRGILCVAFSDTASLLLS
jgi:MFS family permease